jgi:ATP-dependent helicase/nuclease subunit B
MTAAPMIITANARLALVLGRSYNNQQIENGHAAWTAPDILPIGAWLERCWHSWIYRTNVPNPVQLLSPSQERAVWEGIVSRSDAGGELLHVAPTADAAATAWSLAHAWTVSFDGRDWDNTRDTEAFRGWADEFRRICEKRNWMSAALLPEFVSARIATGEIQVPPLIQLAGFIENNPVQQRLFESMRKKNAVVETLLNPDRGGRQSAVRVEFIDAQQEIRASAQWARKLLESSTHSGGGEPVIGIVVPELNRYRSSIERVFSAEFHPGASLFPDKDARRAFNISLGPALSEYPIIQAALQVLRMNPNATIPFDDVTLLLRSPFLSKAQSEASPRAALDLQLRRGREPELTLSDITAGAPAGLISALHEWHLEFATPPRQLPSDWAAAFSRELISIGWPGERPLDSMEYQTTIAWNDLLSELAGLDAATGTLSRGIAVLTLQRLASDRQFQPESETAPVQILGMFEASGMSFDHLWVLGLHDGVWPRSAAPNPFLPLRLQRSRNLPQSSPQRELEFATQLSEQLMASSPTVVLSYASKEKDADLRPSPLFSTIPECLVGDLHLPVTQTHAELLFRSSKIEKIDDSVAPQWNGAKALGGTAIFRLQSACPFQAFAKVRLGADRLETAAPGLSALDRGNLIHDVLAGVWKEVGSHETLVTENSSYLNAVVHDEVESCIRKLATTKRALQEPRFAAIEQIRLEKLVTGWLELEKERQPFIVLPLEENRQVSVGGIELTIRADRIDRLDDGKLVIVDYKTSRHGPSEWDGPRLDEPQLPLYAVTADIPLGAVVFGVVKSGESRFAGLAASNGILPGVKAPAGDDALENRVPEWREILQNLAADFRSGKAAVDPKQPHQTCRICGLHGFCRMSESTLMAESASESEVEVRNG